ncbi:VOC family protein [Corallococcus sp. CA049B]|uniref:Glyoxalase/bleomycin resistance protein/dioxygenase n=1 Tax=Corallococcus coralloides TaxID=184914 RepID=A0A410RM88_CORCK|nr:MULTISPECIES: VOC family protein [Corallococcus]NOJ92415.1 VOC family protein [Corallococcus coralloides]QAT82976.1 glyoxalase/bleomycin resistance protein/dioxygenase [Corallococcus coralloides]RKG87222.1 VOC family protein [Corallococcus sp. CA049B]
MRISVTSVMVDDQSKALKFYTEVLGFVLKVDVPLGPKDRWLTVVAPDAPEGTQILLEPMGFAPARVFQKALFDAGIPLTSFGVDDCQAEYERMVKLGVVFRSKPTVMGPVTVAVFEDTCGNLIQMAQV